MRYLPADPAFGPRGRVLEDEPLSFWIPALEFLRERHGLPPRAWNRFEMGKTAVFELGSDWVIKLIPPFWAEDAAHEAEALRLVHGRVPMETPELVAAEMIDGWTAFVTNRVQGTLLSKVWGMLDGASRAAIARQMGAAAAAFHRIPVSPGSPLAWDWAGMLRERREQLPDHLRESGAPTALIEGLDAFLDSVGPLPTPGAAEVVLHGDMSAGNMVIREHEGHWTLCGILDFGDASTGQMTHEFLSPGVHTFRGEREVLRAFYEGYGLSLSQQTRELQNHLMARTILYYYSWRYLTSTGAATRYDSWEAVAEQFWQMTG